MKGPISQKTFKNLQEDNEKLGLLSKQMKCMNEDFEDMKRAREEAKKQLEAKFQDVYRKIENTKEFIEQEGKRINDTLLAFQEKFTMKLAKAEARLQQQHDEFAKECQENFERDNLRMDELDQKIEDERAERIKQQEDQFKELQEKLQSLQDQIDTEQSERIAGEKNILQKLSDESYNLNEALDKEKTERIFKAKELRDYTEYELHKLQKLNEEFNEKTKDEFMHVIHNLENEMDNRFAHQDQIVDNLSNVVRTIQDTLNVIGNDS